MRKRGKFFVNGGAMHLALRDLLTELSSPVTVAALAGVAIVLGISGPFGTLDAFALIPRLAYWAVVVPLTYGAGFLGARAAHRHLPEGPRFVRMALVALGSALGVTPVLAALHLILGIPLGGVQSVILGFAAVYVICLVIEGVGTVLSEHRPSLAQGPQHSPAGPPLQPPALLARLPFDKRGDLMALSAQDHYTVVQTTKGRALVLIRFADAVTEAAPTPGVKIHRSHWVAQAAITQLRRTGDGGEVTLSTGDTLPVARARLGDLRALGLLPRKAG